MENHQSDCSVHNEPATPSKPCDCGLNVGFKLHELLRYLPYKTKVFDGEYVRELGMPNTSQITFCDFRFLVFDYKDTDPKIPYQLVLYPKWMLIEYIKDEETGELYIPLERLFGVTNLSLYEYEDNMPFQNLTLDFAKGLNGIESKFLPSWIVETLISWHFDVFDYFDDGLAISKIDIE